MTEGFFPPHGGYEALLSYQKAKVAYAGSKLDKAQKLGVKTLTEKELLEMINRSLSF